MIFTKKNIVVLTSHTILLVLVGRKADVIPDVNSCVVRQKFSKKKLSTTENGKFVN